MKAKITAAWRRFRAENRHPCIRCRQPIWFGGRWPEHSYCMTKRWREDTARQQARLVAEELHKLQQP